MSKRTKAIAATLIAATVVWLTGGLSSPAHAAGPQNPLLWLKADAVTGHTDGQTVALWPDSSGNGYDATQTDLGDRPTYQSNGINGYPSLRFHGASFMNVIDPALNLTGQLTVIALAKPTDFSGERGIVGNYAFGNGYMLFETTDDRYQTYTQGAIVQTPPDASDSDLNRAVVYTYGEDADSTDFYIDWVLKASGVSGASALSSQPLGIGRVVGVSGRFLGDMTEVLVYDRALTAVEMQYVQNYFNHTYDLPEPTSAIAMLGIAGVMLVRRRRTR